MKIEIAKFQDGYYYVVDGVKQHKAEGSFVFPSFLFSELPKTERSPGVLIIDHKDGTQKKYQVEDSRIMHTDKDTAENYKEIK